MRKAAPVAYFFCILLLPVLAGCRPIQDPAARSDAFYQVSVINALLQGNYDGSVTVGELLQHGDTGLGTFDHLNGEMIVQDGVVYRAKTDGTVEVVEPSETVPFAAVAYFDEDIAGGELTGIADLDGMKAALDNIIAAQGGDFNQFYLAQIHGTFDLAHVRSVPAQSKPYQPLAEVTKNQVEFNYENIPGVMIALRFPDHMQGINVTGWHLHFVSDDKSKGGHVLDVRLSEGSVSLDVIHELSLEQPETPDFAALDLSGD